MTEVNAEYRVLLLTASRNNREVTSLWFHSFSLSSADFCLTSYFHEQKRKPLVARVMELLATWTCSFYLYNMLGHTSNSPKIKILMVSFVFVFFH